ncbi:MAG: hypothetical protein KF857_00615 [Fimbriimonadaceae bacterium]|nr:hypothetical protein [Fimbriimonadaceae bacterium]
MRFWTVLTAIAMAGAAFAGTITVTSPSNGDFLGQNNQVKFNITGSSAKVTVKATATSVTDPAINITVQDDFTPPVSGEISGSLTLNFNQSVPQGPYTLKVRATEPGNTYNSPADLTLTIDIDKPKFLDFNPLNNSFVKGIVPITASFREENMKEWRVQVGGSDIPNNTGVTNDLLVNWDTTGFTKDGPQSISIKATDKANNQDSKSINLTIDRLPPSLAVNSPRDGDTYRSGSNIPVVLTATDQFSGSLDKYAITVEITTMADVVIGRVARSSVTVNGNSVVWTGRLRATRNLPAQFKLRFTAVDKAGNVATTQTVLVNRGSRVSTRTFR